MLYGGSHFDFVNYLKIHDHEVFNLVKAIQREINIIQVFVAQNMEIPIELLQKLCLGELMSMYESDIFKLIYETFIDKNASFIPIFDGFYLQQEFTSSALISDINKYLKPRYNGYIQLKKNKIGLEYGEYMDKCDNRIFSKRPFTKEIPWKEYDYDQYFNFAVEFNETDECLEHMTSFLQKIKLDATNTIPYSMDIDAYDNDNIAYESNVDESDLDESDLSD